MDISTLLPAAQKSISGLSFLEEINAAKGLGEKITAILFEGNVVTAKNVIEQGLKGLADLPRIGPKKAAAILEFAEKLNQRALERKSEEEDSTATIEETKIIETSGDDKNDIAEEDTDEQEIPIDQLSEIDPSIIENLVKSGFETLAELSVTQKEELMEINGIDEETALVIIEQAKKQSANMDSV